MKVIVLNPFSLDPDSHSNLHGFKAPDDEVSLTVQSDAQGADINYIIKQFGLTQSMPVSSVIPQYQDFSDMPTDYQSALNLVMESDRVFMSYPAEIRARFGNDPVNFISFFNDPANKDEAIKFGFIPAGEGQNGFTPPSDGDSSQS